MNIAETIRINERIGKNIENGMVKKDELIQEVHKRNNENIITFMLRMYYGIDCERKTVDAIADILNSEYGGYITKSAAQATLITARKAYGLPYKYKGCSGYRPINKKKQELNDNTGFCLTCSKEFTLPEDWPHYCHCPDCHPRGIYYSAIHKVSDSHREKNRSSSHIGLS